jgi:hypothetical protein
MKVIRNLSLFALLNMGACAHFSQGFYQGYTGQPYYNSYTQPTKTYTNCYSGVGGNYYCTSSSY